MSETAPMQPSDWRERQTAVDISRSCIVQAPAGSGKTELLVQRILALLAVADVPEEILSITFTRKAAGEMRARLLQALERSNDDRPPEEPHAIETWQKARAVLARDRQQGWALLENPNRLQLLTIDGFCAFLTRRMPWLSRFGDQPAVSDDPEELYLQAAEELLARLDAGGSGQDAIEQLLAHLDNRLPMLRDLLVNMLGRRDQWLRHLMPHRNVMPRQVLEDGLRHYVHDSLQRTAKALGSDICNELRELALYAAGNLAATRTDHPLAALLEEQEDISSARQWLALTSLVLTASGTVRKTVTVNVGFPADRDPAAASMKARALGLLARLADDTPACEALLGIRRLPSTSYSAEQWPVLQALVELLPLAVVELQEAFRRKGRVDFIEIAGAARAALGSVTEPEELLLQMDSRIRHVLVDEFQDTSYAQYDLLRCLTGGWEPGDGRTLFVVGDPMQSIYRFREADVGLYLRVCLHGLDNLPMDRIVLRTNFRSDRILVDWTNLNFGSLFPPVEDEVRGAVRYAPAEPADRSGRDGCVSVHCFVERQDEAEAAQVVELVRLAMTRDREGTTAVLVRSRSHLVEIAGALKNAGLRFQAQDIVPLADRQAIRDVLSLARALQHPADRVAWLAVLRAPWCGLTLHDLTELCGGDARATIWEMLTQPADQAELFDRISPDGRGRLSRIVPVLERGLAGVGRLGWRRLLESTWLALSGPACVDSADLLDVEQFFSLLDGVGSQEPVDNLFRKLEGLFAAPDPQAGPEVQLMTIHKAKGLEFDTVILPGLGRGVRPTERTLLRWLEHPDYGLLLAPIPPLLGDQQEPTYMSLGSILREKDDLETLRLFYVAVTRAKSRLHLLGHVIIGRDGQLIPRSGSLLATAWPALDDQFAGNIVNKEDEEPKAQTDRSLRRLPSGWLPPRLPEAVAITAEATAAASASGHLSAGPLVSLHTEEGRVVGILAHLWLEKIAGDDVRNWTSNEIKAKRGAFGLQLGALGIPRDRLDACTSQLETCLVNALESERGRWLLGRQDRAACELPLNGMVAGKLVRATIDRTFVDADGIRWVIDYKTSSPASGESCAQFMAEEAKRYHEQLRLYSALAREYDPDRKVRAALYFPTFNGWREVDVETI